MQISSLSLWPAHILILFQVELYTFIVARDVRACMYVKFYLILDGVPCLATLLDAHTRLVESSKNL